jgi:hypothetical protein
MITTATRCGLYLRPSSGLKSKTINHTINEHARHQQATQESGDYS